MIEAKNQSKSLPCLPSCLHRCVTSTQSRQLENGTQSTKCPVCQTRQPMSGSLTVFWRSGNRPPHQLHLRSPSAFDFYRPHRNIGTRKALKTRLSQKSSWVGSSKADSTKLPLHTSSPLATCSQGTRWGPLRRDIFLQASGTELVAVLNLVGKRRVNSPCSLSSASANAWSMKLACRSIHGAPCAWKVQSAIPWDVRRT